ncbi:MAG: DKNYY domain-containing protein [Verrucomicrobium sp.]
MHALASTFSLRLRCLKPFRSQTVLALTSLLSLGAAVGCSASAPSGFSASGYHVRGAKVYYHGGFGISSPVELTGADAASFRKLDDIEPRSYYAQDKSNVYYCGKVMPEAQPATFVRMRNAYARDARQVYYQGYAISSDAANFKLLDELAGKDSRRVYWCGHVISEDAPNFRYVGHSGAVAYHRDRQQVFANGIRIEGADSATFRILSQTYSRDSKRVYQLTKPVFGADSNTFQVLTRFYTKDASQVFWDGKLIAGANPETFVILNEDSHCSHDGVHAYHWNNVIRGADPATFPVGKKCRSCWENRIVFEE